MRINKYLAAAGLGSRRGVEGIIREGKVKVGGEVVGLGYQVKEGDEVIVEGKKIVVSGENEYWMVNKPRGVVSTSKDSHDREVVTSLVKSDKRLFAVGRLDKESEGMMILTNDGEWAMKVTHPRFGVVKEYEVEIKGRLGGREMKKMREGVVVEGKRLEAERIEREGMNEGKAKLRFWLKEGKKREIRRMVGVVGGEVVSLRRVAIGGLRLGDLEEGEARKLDDKEVEKVMGKE